jgi:hypothetical protein
MTASGPLQTTQHAPRMFAKGPRAAATLCSRECPLRHVDRRKLPFRYRPTQVTADLRPSRSLACRFRQPESGLNLRLVR